MGAMGGLFVDRYGRASGRDHRFDAQRLGADGRTLVTPKHVRASAG